MSIGESMEKQSEEFLNRFRAVREQLGRVIVGHDEIVEGVLTCLFVGGHCLLEGVPGLGKTLLVRTLAEVLDLDFSRIQFTPDLMPADILGTNMVVETPDGKRIFEFQKGPIFTQICLADEINRATPKTQSAMLETMQEGTVTAGGHHYVLKKPFFVLATQNPIEQEGTYPLPEAQLDRFFFKLVVGYSNRAELATIIDRTTRGIDVRPTKVMEGTEILRWQKLIREVVLAPHVQDYVVRLTLATHPDSPFAFPVTNKYLRWGAQSARRTNSGPGVEDACLTRAPLQRQLRGCTPHVSGRDASSSDPKLRGAGRGDHQRQDLARPAGSGAGESRRNRWQRKHTNPPSRPPCAVEARIGSPLGAAALARQERHEKRDGRYPLQTTNEN